MFTVFLAALLAFVDFGLALFIRATFQHAVREGVRYAITYQTQSGMGQDASIKAKVQTNSLGFLADHNNKIMIRYYRPDTFALTAYNGPGNLVEVSIEGYAWQWVVPLMRQKGSLAINARASDRMEGLPGGATPPTR